jgi:DNA-binding GntR family transcriptional regulator
LTILSDLVATDASPRIAAESLDGLRIKRSSTADQVADALREMITRGDIAPGTPLPEIALADSVGVSRNTTREALRILAREGLVTHHMHRGAAVATLTEEDVTDIFRVRRALELRAVAASSTATPRQLASLREAVDQLETAAGSGNWDGVIEGDVLFHERLLALLGSPRLHRFFQEIQGELRLCLALVDRQDDDPAPLVAEHRELCELIQSGERERCIAKLDAHLADGEQVLRSIVNRRTEGLAVARGGPTTRQSTRGG